MKFSKEIRHCSQRVFSGSFNIFSPVIFCLKVNLKSWVTKRADGLQADEFWLLIKVSSHTLSGPLEHYLCCWMNPAQFQHKHWLEPSGFFVLHASSKDNMKVTASSASPVDVAVLCKIINKIKCLHAEIVSHTDCKTPHWDWPWRRDLNHNVTSGESSRAQLGHIIYSSWLITN